MPVFGLFLNCWAILCMSSMMRKFKVQASAGCSGTVSVPFEHLHPQRAPGCSMCFTSPPALCSTRCSACLQPVTEINDLGLLQACSCALCVQQSHLPSRYPVICLACGVRFKGATVEVFCLVYSIPLHMFACNMKALLKFSVHVTSFASELETFVEDLKKDSAASSKTVTLKDVEDGAFLLRQVGEAVATLKGMYFSFLLLFLFF